MMLLPLVVRSFPVAGESARGYLLRLSSANGLRNPAMLRGALKIPNMFYVSAAECGRLLDAVGGGKMPPGFAYEATADNRFLIEFGSTQIPRIVLNTTKPRVCPECIIARGIAPQLWDIKPYVACHIHGRLLVDACGQCNRHLSWDRRGLIKCVCGADLRSPTQPASPDLVAISTLLAAKVQLTPSATDQMSLGIGQISLLTWFFACSSIADGKAKPAANANVSEAASLLLKVADIPLGWPSSLSTWLDRNRIENSDGFGVHSDFGQFPGRLKATFDVVGYDFATNELARYLSNDWNGLEVKAWSPLHRHNNNRIRLTHASQQLCISTQEVHYLTKSGDLDGDIRSKGGRIFGWITRSSLEKFVAARPHRLTLPEAGEYLGLTAPQVRSLIKNEIIKYDGKYRSSYLIYKIDIESFIDRIRTAAVKRPSNIVFQEFMRIGDLADHGSWSFSRNIRAILAGRLPIYRPTKRKALVSDFLVPRSRLERLAGGIVISASAELGNMNVAQAAKFLNVSTTMIGAIAKAGFITPSATSGIGNVSFSVRELSRFRDKYAFSWQVIIPSIASHERHSNFITYHLRRCGIEPALKPNGRAKVFAVWRKADLASIDGITYRLEKLGSD